MILKILNWFRFAVCILLLAAVALWTREIVERSQDQQVRKYDLANINHMKYSLFSVNLWKKKIAGIVVKEIQNFKVDDNNKETLRKHLEAQLDVLIDKVNDQIKESNKDSAKGWFKQHLMDFLVDIKVIKQGIPNYADAIVKQMTDDKTQSQVKDMIKEKVTKYLERTFEKQDTAETDEIVVRTGTTSMAEARDKLAETVPPENKHLMDLTVNLLVAAVLLFALAAIHRGGVVPAPFFFVLWVLLVILLYAGVTCPMIDMEARIANFGFTLLGYNIEFHDINVYFQSKSVIDVFLILIHHEKIEMRVVGVLMVLFSIVFPILKLTSSLFYYYDVLGVQKRWLMKAIVLKSGKWSMADVLVVAILMAYIGFNGMVTTQMDLIAATVPGMTFISTNGTTLQFGFYIFLTYAILAMFFSGMSRRPKAATSPDRL